MAADAGTSMFGFGLKMALAMSGVMLLVVAAGAAIALMVVLTLGRIHRSLGAEGLVITV
jgi:hypothetical protein